MIGSWSFKRTKPDEWTAERRAILEKNKDLLSCCPGEHTRVKGCLLRPMRGEEGYVAE